MKLAVLMDNHTYIDRYYCGEPAFCCYIEDGDHNILFDVGYSPLYIENARRMGIDLSKVTDIALSHGHDDHTGGLKAFFEEFTQPVKLYRHPFAFLPKRSSHCHLSCGTPWAEIPTYVEQVVTDKPVKISENVLFLGEIPRTLPFETGREVGEMLVDGKWIPDAVPDDTSLLLGNSFLLTGCAHSGVCNTFLRAAELAGNKPKAILGGMHLLEMTPDYIRAMEYLKDAGVQRMYPAHCTCLEVKAGMYQYFPQVFEVGVGMHLEFDEKGIESSKVI